MHNIRTVVVWEIVQRKFFTVWWTIGVSSLITITALSYKALDSQTQQLNQDFKGLTDSAGGFFGGSDFFSPAGYLSSQIYYILLPVLLIIMAVFLANSLLARDENDTTVELVLARPISRRQLLLAKALAGAGIVCIIAILSLLVTILSVHAANIQISTWHLTLTHLLSFLFSLSFGVIAFSCIAVSRLTRRVGSVVAAIFSFGGYIIASLSSFVHWLQTPSKFMPYHYYDTISLLQGHIHRGLIAYLLLAYTLALLLAFWGYSRRDIG